MRTLSPPLKSSAADHFINKGTLISIFLFFNLMISYRVLLISPIPEVEMIAELIYEFVLIFYVIYRVISRIISRNSRVNPIEIYLGILFLLPLQAAFAAWNEFGQPIIYGIGTYRDWYLLYSALVVYNMIRSGMVSLELVERMFLLTAWVSISIFYFMSLFTNPANHTEGSLAGRNTAKGGDAYYRFNMTFVFFGSIYYFVKAFYKNKVIYIAYGLLFLIYVVFFRFDRTSIAVLIGAIAAFYITAITPRRQLTWLFFSIAPIITVILVVSITAPEIFTRYYLMFADAFATLFGSYTPKQEESVRVDEVRIAFEGIRKHPIIGNGKVSGKWVEGGYNYFLGFFYVSDVGIFGQVYLYGFLGAFILYYQFVLLYYYAFKIKHIKRNTFLVTLKFFALALALDSITQGYLTNYAAQSIMAMVLVYAFYERDRVINAKIKAGEM